MVFSFHQWVMIAFMTVKVLKGLMANSTKNHKIQEIIHIDALEIIVVMFDPCFWWYISSFFEFDFIPIHLTVPFFHIIEFSTCISPPKNIQKPVIECKPAFISARR